MIALLLLALGAQASPAEPAPDEPLHAVLARVRERAEEDPGSAAELAAALLERDLEGAERAEARFAEGVARALAAETSAADAAFAAAAALAGPGELRLDALYDRGVAHLEEGERRFAAARDDVPAAPAAALPPGVEPPDPLALARASYERARERLVERLRLDWRDPDVRANLELVQRRLRAIEELEREREERAPEPRPEPSPEGEPSPDAAGGEPAEGEPRPGEEGAPPPEGAEPRGAEGAEAEAPEGAREEPRAGAEEGPPAEPGPESPPEPSGDARTADALPPLSPAEVTRLLDLLRELEEEQALLEEARRARGRIRVERDW